MSTDFDVACDRCMKYIHLGQRFAGGWTFGFGTDDYDMMKQEGAFIQEHVGCRSLRICLSDTIDETAHTPSDYEDAQRRGA